MCQGGGGDDVAIWCDGLVNWDWSIGFVECLSIADRIFGYVF